MIGQMTADAALHELQRLAVGGGMMIVIILACVGACSLAKAVCAHVR